MKFSTIRITVQVGEVWMEEDGCEYSDFPIQRTYDFMLTEKQDSINPDIKDEFIKGCKAQINEIDKMIKRYKMNLTET